MEAREKVATLLRSMITASAYGNLPDKDFYAYINELLSLLAEGEKPPLLTDAELNQIVDVQPILTESSQLPGFILGVLISALKRQIQADTIYFKAREERKAQEVIDQINKVLGPAGLSIGSISADGKIEECILCDKADGDEIDPAVLSQESQELAIDQARGELIAQLSKYGSDQYIAGAGNYFTIPSGKWVALKAKYLKEK